MTGKVAEFVPGTRYKSKSCSNLREQERLRCTILIMVEQLHHNITSIVTAFGALATSTKWLKTRSKIRASLVNQQEPVEQIICLALGRLDNNDLKYTHDDHDDHDDHGDHDDHDDHDDYDSVNLQVSFQIAFLLLLCNELRIPPEKRIVYDPRHTDHDRKLLKLIGLNPKKHDLTTPVNCKTLYYMPFAPWTLTETIVSSNWIQLDRISIIGNSFQFVSIGPRYKSQLIDSAKYEKQIRAPHVELTRSICDEIECYESDNVTWLPTVTNQNQLNCTLVTFPVLNKTRRKQWILLKPVTSRL